MTAVLTEPPRTVVRRWWFWLAVGVLVLVVAIVSTAVGAAPAPGTPLSPTNAAPEGSKALAQVLEEHGIDLVIPATLAEAVSAADQPRTTLLLDDPSGLIGTYGNAAIERAAARIVLLEPPADTLLDYGGVARPATLLSGSDDPASADCPLGPVQRAGEIDGDSWTYEVLADDATQCWRAADGAPRLVQQLDGDQELDILGTTGLLENQRITEAGNAAFALGLLGATPRLVWFQPDERAGWSAEDGGTGAAETPTIGSVSPAWVVPVMLLLIATAIAAAVWRGRRFGRLLVEPLPAIVPADETVRGRARLYARAHARLRAADALRIGTIGRLATALGQPSTADVDEIAAATAAITGRRIPDLLGLLRDLEPANDRDLVRLSDELLRLETELTGRMKP